MAHNNIHVDFGSLGILDLNGQRYGVKAMTIRQQPDYYPLFEGYLIPDAFAQSNALRAGRNPEIKKVIFNDPVTVVIWNDGTKTIVRCQPGDTYAKETGLALCIAKKSLGNKGNFNEVFKKWIPEETEPVEKVEELSVEEMRKRLEDLCNNRAECEELILGDECPLINHACTCNFKLSHCRPMTDDEIRAAYKVAFNRK